MNNLRQLCMALVLTLILSATAFADGPVNCPGVTQPPPEEITSETQSEAESDSTITATLLILIEGVFLVV